LSILIATDQIEELIPYIYHASIYYDTIYLITQEEKDAVTCIFTTPNFKFISQSSSNYITTEELKQKYTLEHIQVD
jgi:hypothetical protein